MAIYITSTARTKHGFTLTELAIVLGIMGTILGAIWVASSRVSENYKVQKAAGQIPIIFSGYRSLYGIRGIDDPTPWDDVTCLGINAGYFPSDMIPSVACGTAPTGHPLIPWSDGYALVRSVQSKNMIVVQYGPFSQSACISLASSVFNSSDMMYQYIWSNGTSNSQYLAGNTPWTTAQINGFCNSVSKNYIAIGVSAQ